MATMLYHIYIYRDRYKKLKNTFVKHMLIDILHIVMQMEQKILLSDCDEGPKTYYTTNDNKKNTKKVKIETSSDDGSLCIELCSEGQYKIVIGFFRYCLRLTPDDGVDNMLYVPSTEKINYRGDIYYKIGNYNVKEFNFENNENEFSISNNSGIVLDIDILELSKLPDNVSTMKINRKQITESFPYEIYLDFERTSTLDGGPHDSFYATSYKEGYKYAKKMINIVQNDFSECEIDVLNKMYKTNKFIWKSNDFGLIYTCHMRDTIIPDIRIDESDHEIKYFIFYFENLNLIRYRYHETDIKRNIKEFFTYLKREFSVTFKNKNKIHKKFNNHELVLLTKKDINENDKIFDLYIALNIK